MRSADCVEFTCVLAIYSSPLYCTCLWLYDTWVQRVAGQPVIQPNAGAVKSARERIIKLLVDVRVDATHQSTALDIFQ